MTCTKAVFTATVRVGCINVRDLRSPWKQGRLLNDLRSLDLNVVAVSETRISGAHDLVSIFDDYEIYASFSRPGMEGEWRCCRKASKFRRSSWDLEDKLVILDESDSEGSAFRIVVVYARKRAEQPEFRHNL